MAGEVLKYDLIYREDGKEKKDVIEISFVSNWCIRQFNEISTVIRETTERWDQHSDVMTLVAAKSEGGEVEESFEELQERQDQIIQDMRDGVGEGFFKKRFDLLQVILVDNGLKDSKYDDFDFWDRHVEPAVLNDFLNECIFKDIDKKKAV